MKTLERVGNDGDRGGCLGWDVSRSERVTIEPSSAPP